MHHHGGDHRGWLEINPGGFRHQGLVLALVGGLLGGGCLGSSPPSRYYTLSASTPRPAARTGPPVRTIRVAPVSLPESLDRPQMLRRTGENTVEVLEFERWIEPLDVLLRNTLVADLSAQLPDADVLGSSAPGIAADQTVGVSIELLEAKTSGEMALDAVWFILPRGAEAPKDTHRTSVRQRAASGQPVDIAAAVSQAVEQLSRDIATQLRSSR
jgi:uncharacterized protein